MTRNFLSTVCALGLPLQDAAIACCALGRPGKPVVNADQTVLLIWDAATQTEHFIRKASFRSDDADFGFLVPTPSRPQLSESGDAAFPYLADITRPLENTHGGFGCSAPPRTQFASGRSVQVVEHKAVAGFDAAVLAAASPTALNQWLKQHGYHSSAEVEAWAAPYIHAGWMITALRVAKDGGARSELNVNAAALRISFHAPRPLFPYREPDSRAAAQEVGARARLLRLYFISDGRYAGSLDGGDSWTGKPVWSGALSSGQKRDLLTRLRLPDSTGPTSWWLTEFEDRWPYGLASGDLCFTPVENQKPLRRHAAGGGRLPIDLSLPLIAVTLGATAIAGCQRPRR